MSDDTRLLSIIESLRCDNCHGSGVYLFLDEVQPCNCKAFEERVSKAIAYDKSCPLCYDVGILNYRRRRLICSCIVGQQIKREEEAEFEAYAAQTKIDWWQEIETVRPWTSNQVILAFMLWGGILVAIAKSIQWGGYALLMTASISSIVAAVVHLLLVRDEKGHSWVSRSPWRQFFYRGFLSCLTRILIGVVGGVLLYQGASRLTWFWPLCMVLGGVSVLIGALFLHRKQ